MLQAPVELLPYVGQTIRHLAHTYPLMVITKGDLLDQEAKIARSGLADYFTAIEIVSQKNETVYGDILQKHSIAPPDFLMVGNSPKSDIVPVLNLGAQAVHIPYQVTWAHEAYPGLSVETKGYFQLKNMRELLNLLGIQGELRET